MCMRPRRWTALAIAAGIVVFFGLYFYGAHSEGFRFLDDVVRRSPAIKQRVGDVQAVRLSFLKGYHEKGVGSDVWTTMTLNVTGSQGSVSVKASATKERGVWTASNATIDGTPVKLD